MTRTFEVKVGLPSRRRRCGWGPPSPGGWRWTRARSSSLPASAVTRQGDEPAVWVVDPQSSTVGLRSIDVLRFEPAYVVVASGVEPGEVVVTAGVQALHPGQKVRVLEARS